MDSNNVHSLLSSSTTDRVHNANGLNEIIDLTASFVESPIINWPTGIIELNEVTDSPPIRRRRLNGQHYPISESQIHTDIVVINDSPAPVAPLIRPRKTTTKNRGITKTDQKDKDNSQRRTQTELNFRDRSPIFFGDCPICFEPLGKNPLASTKCGHVFCVKCLQRALKISKRCPNCRKGLPGKTAYHPLYFS